MGAKTYTKAEGSKTRRDPEKGPNGHNCTLQEVFSRTYSPDSQCPCRHQRWTLLAPPEGRSSLTDTQDLPSFPYLLATRPGLPLLLSVTAKRRNSTQGRSRLVAAWQGFRTLGKSTSWDLHYHLQAHITLSFCELKQHSQTRFGITVWASPIL